MDHHGPGEVVKRHPAGQVGEPRIRLPQKIDLPPHHAFEEGVDESDKDRGGQSLDPEFSALGDAAGDDGRDSGGKGQQEEKMDQFITLVVRQQGFRRSIKIDAIGDGVTDGEVDDGGNGKIDDDLDQGVHLIFFADRPHLQKGESAMHGKHHHRAQHQEQHIAAVFQGPQILFHNPPPFFRQ